MNEETKLSQLSENMRFFADMRFKQLTLFMAAMTAVAGGVVESSQYRWWIALGGLCITMVIWMMEVRSTMNFITVRDECGNSAEHLWPRKKPKVFPWLTASRDVLLLYAGFYIFWLSCIKKWCAACYCSFYSGVVVGAALVVFSIANDPDLRKNPK
jgi:hypothetical protein